MLSPGKARIEQLSGPTPDTAAALVPIEDKRQLVGYLAAGSKPKAQWRIGTEHEKFAFLTERWRRCL
jgi:glutamate--cysteine ligase